jgi:aspartate kinase
MKFGGTSVADVARMRNAARFVQREVDAGRSVAVVVSAMAGETNRLVALCREAGRPQPALDARDVEYDVVVASGEQVTSGLLALILQNLGYRARSWQGWQIPLTTDSTHGRARIAAIRSLALGEALDSGEVAVVAGFQGVNEGRVTTLGRGGSDTTAVALAVAVRAERCDIYTDVDGVYTTDPRIHKGARRLDRVSFEEMLEMASVGAKVLQTRSVELAMAYKMPVRVLSSFDAPEAPGPGTLICDEDAIVEKKIVSGVTLQRDEAKISLLSVPDEPGKAAAIFSLLADANINVDMIVQSPSRSAGNANISFTLPEGDLDRAVAMLSDAKGRIGFAELQSDRNVAKVSVIGVGMKSHAGVAATMFKTLGERKINIQNISTSEIKISVLIEAEYAELAVRALHHAYGLDPAPAGAL